MKSKQKNPETVAFTMPEPRPQAGEQERPENVEFSELVKQMEDFGFRPADVARMLNKSPGAISQYLSGYTKPSKTVLELLRRVVKEKDWDDIEPNAEHKELSKKLRFVSYVMRSKYSEIKSQIETLYESLYPELRRMAIMNARAEKSELSDVKINSSNAESAISLTGSRPAEEQPQSENNPPKTRNVPSESKRSTKS
jgi:predicted transcriptional regulator